jgi:hypothetical protein
VKRLISELVNNMENYSSLVNEKQFTKRVPTPKPEVNEPLLNPLVKIEQLLLETVRFLDNCPLRGEQWVNEQIECLMKELEYIQEAINKEVFL